MPPRWRATFTAKFTVSPTGGTTAGFSTISLAGPTGLVFSGGGQATVRNGLECEAGQGDRLGRLIDVGICRRHARSFDLWRGD
jgi:hypothetical protein